MLVFSQRARVADVKSLSRRMYAYAFLDDFVLLYPVYALLFAENGLSVAEISSLFVIWSVTGLVLEVPSGALADATSRRLLMTVGPLLSAAGFGIWVLFESYPAFALGFILWGVKGALQSGAQEALLYEELDRLGGADRYATVVGRSRAFGTGGILLATALAAPVFGLGGYPALGAASAAACLACALVASGFPEHRQARDASGPGSAFREYADTLRQGLREVRGNPPARRAVLLIPVVAGIWGSLEEYVPLLAASATPRTQTVALLILLVSAGVAAGALLSGRAARLRMRGVAWLLAAAAIGLAAGALSGRLLGFALIAAAFAVFQLVDVVVGVRLQNAIDGSARATVTSVAGLGTDVATIGIVALYGLSATVFDHGVTFALGAAAYLLLAATLARRPARDGAR